MNIGDKVREIHGEYEGIVSKIHANGICDVEIEDGFVIPMAKNSLVVVSQAEKEYFQNQEQNDAVTELPLSAKVSADKGVYLTFVNSSRTTYTPSLVNNTDYLVLISCYKRTSKGYKSAFAYALNQRSSKRLADLSFDDFNEWKTLHFTIVIQKDELDALEEPIQQSVKVKANRLNNTDDIPLSTTDKGYVIQIDQFVKAKLVEEKIEVEAVAKPNKPNEEIDLHAEKLGLKEEKNPSKIFTHQLRVFENYLNDCVVFGLSRVKVIHGKGNGILKREIERRVEQHPHVQFAKMSNNDSGETVLLIK